MNELGAAVVVLRADTPEVMEARTAAGVKGLVFSGDQWHLSYNQQAMEVLVMPTDSSCTIRRRFAEPFKHTVNGSSGDNIREP
jgi:hypothetical protein